MIKFTYIKIIKTLNSEFHFNTQQIDTLRKLLKYTIMYYNCKFVAKNFPNCLNRRAENIE